MFGISITLLSIPIAAYLLGSIPFGLLLAKLLGGLDVRKAGSGNIGATNVARAAGPLAGILTLLLDAAKGAVAILLAERLSGGSATWMMIAAMASLVGHCYPIWLNFRGGKGVATAAGFFIVLSPITVCRNPWRAVVVIFTVDRTTFVAVKTFVSLAITISAIVLTVSWSIRTARAEDLVFARVAQ